MKAARSCLFLLALLSANSSALAEDAKKTSLTVLPATQASLVFTEADKAATVEYAHILPGDWLLYLKATAPLDEDTRIAAFTKDNNFATGLNGSIQFGRDERGARLRELKKRLELASKGLKILTRISDKTQPTLAIDYDEEQDFRRKHRIISNPDFNQYVCGGCSSPELEQAICRKLGDAACAAEPNSDLLRERLRMTAESMARSCPLKVAGSGNAEQCLVARWWLRHLNRERAFNEIQELVADVEAKQALWKIFEGIEPEKFKEITKGGKDDQVFVDHLEEISGAIKRGMRRSVFEQRDLLLTGSSGGAERCAQSITGDLNLQYDRLSIHQDDLASKAIEEAKYEVSAGVNYDVYDLAPGLALHTRLGLSHARDPKAKKVELCTLFPSEDSTISGKKCDSNALFRAGAAPDPETSANLRVALTYQYGVDASESDLVPGIELRGAIEDLGADESVAGRLTLFGTPIKGTSAARVGIALDVSYAINIGSADSRWAITPLVFIGASFSQLFSTSL